LKKRTLFFTLLGLLLVFLVSYFFAFIIIVSTPSENYRQQVYSKPQSWVAYNSSDLGGVWEQQNLFLGPSPGSTGIPRDTAIWIGEPRPVGIKNLSLSPQAGILTRVDEHSLPASADITVYPGELLQPNTRYNVSAIVAGTPSWWIFTTSSEPSQKTFSNTQLTFNGMLVALTTATAVTLIASTTILIQKKRHTKMLGSR
jgi:hypothetical protein